jgi:N-acetylglutamate synthase-like GNAT family acetyltransferase
MQIVPLEHAPKFACTIADWIESEWGVLDILDYYKLISENKKNDADFPQCLIAISGDDRVMGTISILLDDMNIRPNLNPWLGCLYVDPIYRCRSVAKCLFAACEVLAHEKKIPKLYLWTSKIHSMAEKFGWSHIERVIFENENVYIMEKIITEYYKI